MRIGPIIQFCTSDRPEHFEVFKHLAHLFIFNLGKRRVHHENQADGDRNIGCARLELFPESRDARKEIPPADTDKHGKKNPERQIAVEKRKFFCQAFSHDSFLLVLLFFANLLSAQRSCCFSVTLDTRIIINPGFKLLE